MLTLNWHEIVTQDSYTRDSVNKKSEGNDMSFDSLLASIDGYFDQVKSVKNPGNHIVF